MKLSDYLVSEIYRITKTDKFFGYIGGMVAHIVDSIYKNDAVEMVNMITEQGAGFAAEGYARTTQKVGIALATSGPGATNLVTPIANCFFDSTPTLFITGQVNTYEYRKYDIKQCGFQETNIVDIVKPITKYAKIITNPNEIKYELEKALHIANSGRKGPVLLDIPMDIQRAEIEFENLHGYEIEKQNLISSYNFDISLLKNAQKPLVLVGNGINLSNAKENLNKFLRKNNIPVVSSLLGIDNVLCNYKYNLGLIGTYGERYGNLALYMSDLLLVIGSRLDIRQTGGKTDFLRNKTIIHVDIDEKELNCQKFNKIKIHADANKFLEHLNSMDLKLDISNWQDKCAKIKEKFSYKNKIYKTPNVVLNEIFANLKENDVVVSDVGQNQVWVAQSAIIKKGQRLFSSGGHGCMGFALPSGIGSAITGKRVIVFTGDGGLQMNIQELEILKRRRLPVKIIVLNNKNLGMVRAFQELYFEGRLASTVEDYSCPDFIDVANAYKIPAISINSREFKFNLIEQLINSNEPALININFETHTQVEPRLQFGNSIENLHPLLNELELKEYLK